MDEQRWAAALALVLAWTLAPASAQTTTPGGTRAAGPQATGGAPAPAPYGPVLVLHGKPVLDQATPARRDPAEVHDETDTGANPAAASPPQSRQQDQQAEQEQQRRRQQQAARRHPAWQDGNEAMAPRPLRAGTDAGAGAGAGRAAARVPLAPPAVPPQPVVPSSSVINGCQGSLCTDASGKTYNGIGGGIGSGNAGVNGNGRLCTRTGVTVQCF